MDLVILGMSPTKDEAPEGVETWGLPWAEEWVKCDRLFEMHNDNEWFTPSYVDKLRDVWQPLYMQEAHEDIPTSIAYPLDKAINLIGDYLASSIAYMLVLAILENKKHVGIYGVDMKEEYFHQRPNFEYIIGFAKARGMKITLPESCPILKNHPKVGYRYGYK